MKPPITPGPAAQLAAANIRRARNARRLSQEAVVTAMAKAGHPIGRSALSDIEQGRRRIDVDDLVALAAVLEVTTEQLLQPCSDVSDNSRRPRHRAVDMAAELASLIRGLVTSDDVGIVVAAEVRAARRLLAQLALELDGVEDGQVARVF